jgi:DNA-binding MarR family transcriptional regulator/ribosomal protein S18 acetylase RimI-like enzyme
MNPTEAPIENSEQIAAIRAFNRFYTARLGLLRKRHLDGEFSLTEARILYEIGATPQLTARALCGTLELDAGYMSRTLALLTKRKLIRQLASKQDGREKLLMLTALGQGAVEKLNRQSESQIEQLLANIDLADRAVLVRSLAMARSILSESKEAERASVHVVRLTEANQEPLQEALQLLEEYYEAVQVVLRDTPQAISTILNGRSSGLWVAYLEGKAVGCVLLRELASIPHAVECKRLYVRPAARGRGIADKLMQALEAFAQAHGAEFVYLDSHSGLRSAIALYRNRGYIDCERYNENPQATVFLRKRISGPFSS